MHPLPLGELAATPWSLNPYWFVALALGIPALLWLALAWRRALLECPNRVRRAGIREMRRLLKVVQHSDGLPRPAHLHAWLRVTARVWNVRTSAPCVGEVSQAAHALSGDRTVSSRWRELWQTTEHGLYGPNTQPAHDWLERAKSAAATVNMPKRERLFPNRLSHWLPSVACALLVLVFGPQSLADVPWSSPSQASNAAANAEQESAPQPADESLIEPAPEPMAPEVAQAARTALESHWNDWAAHRNLAAFQTQEGELNQAIAHAVAAFIQHPTGSATRETLLAALGETESVDRSLRRLLAGAWYERAPALLSPAAWQRLALFASLVTAAGCCTLVLSLYSSSWHSRLPRHVLLWTGRGAAALGALLLIASIAGWNAYGAFGHPQAAILVQNANVTPVPTDLVPTEETSPLSAGAVVVAGRRFLGWREVSSEPEISGWIRSEAVMSLYAQR
ncbi:hypothetical protein JM946_17715 [Steroidobacter sp. S1-65]|uniref:SH3 domain-containing protein n=1 Tax=Steroidobacter gossypii TaxID=2805490 RepID=A0ABS1X016_9GAMM|nr:hypothetical protein [Steroidobacter gossypii]MBM0106570.1 hypothetical protein [Steroidobacter gossypii]